MNQINFKAGFSNYPPNLLIIVIFLITIHNIEIIKGVRKANAIYRVRNSGMIKKPAKINAPIMPIQLYSF